MPYLTQDKGPVVTHVLQSDPQIFLISIRLFGFHFCEVQKAFSRDLSVF